MRAEAAVHAHRHPTPVWFTALLAIGAVDHHHRAPWLGWCPLHGPHWTESPCAPFGVLPRGGWWTHTLERRSPLLIATTRSCARPHPAHGLRTLAWAASLCRLLRAPAGTRAFPTFSPPAVCRGVDPYPAALLRGACPFLPAEPRPHLPCNRFGAL